MRSKHIEALPSEIWKRYKGPDNPFIRRIDALVGRLRVKERLMLPLIGGRTTREGEIHINRILPARIKRSVLAHELGHILGKHVEQRLNRPLQDFEEEYVARVVEHLLKKGELPHPKRKMGISFTLIPVRQRVEFIRAIKELFNIGHDKI